MAGKILIRGAILRGLWGIVAIVRPQLILGHALINASGMSEARYFNRLLGARDLVGAALTVAAVRAGAERKAATVNLACEILDSVSILGELVERREFDRTLRGGLFFNLDGYVRWLRALHAL